MNRYSRQTSWLLLLCILFTCFFCALQFGAVDISVRDLFWQKRHDSMAIIWQLRLPRILLALSTGALLALCGAAAQGLFRNPLADPSLIGVSAGASLGASLVLFLGITSGLSLSFDIQFSVVSLGAFAGSVIAVVLVYRIATGAHGTSVPTMLLVGIAVSAVAGSLTSLLEYFSNDATLRRISLWRMGGLDGANYYHVAISVLLLFTSFVLLYKLSFQLNALLLGEQDAQHLGVNVVKLKRAIILVIAAGVGISVALAGMITFVGLIVPHFMRIIMGPNHKYLLPACVLGGAILLSAADTLSRTVITPSELPVGLLTALLGAPLFIFLLYNRRQYEM